MGVQGAVFSKRAPWLPEAISSKRMVDVILYLVSSQVLYLSPGGVQ